MFDRFSERARRAVFFSRYEASRVGQRVIDSEHILLGLLREEDFVTGALWHMCELSPREVQAKFPSIETRISSSAELPLSEDARTILTHAVLEAETHHDAAVDPIHLVLAILRLPECNAAVLLREYGMDYEMVSEISALLMPQARLRAELEERTPVILEPSHYELLDRLAEGMKLSEARPTNRQALALAMIDAVIRSRIGEETFSSVETLKTAIVERLIAGRPG
jgi:ATP-dependent Clp protease ATP-binding subunit ClpA